MLQKLAEHISDAWLREQRAREAPNESQQQGCLRLAKGYSQLAKSYTFVETLENFLLDLHEAGWSSKTEGSAQAEGNSSRSFKIGGLFK